MEETIEWMETESIKSVEPPLKKLKLTGTVIVADDSEVNLEAIRYNLEKIGVSQGVKFCFDGKEAVDEAMAVLNHALQQMKPGQKRIRPISAFLLDVQMPYKTGI